MWQALKAFRKVVELPADFCGDFGLTVPIVGLGKEVPDQILLAPLRVKSPATDDVMVERIRADRVFCVGRQVPVCEFWGNLSKDKRVTKKFLFEEPEDPVLDLLHRRGRNAAPSCDLCLRHPDEREQVRLCCARRWAASGDRLGTILGFHRSKMKTPS